MDFHKKYLLYLLLIIFTWVKAQEIPPIVNYSPEDYQGGNQNWKISQANNKHIYIANNDGLLEFNGANWKLYPSPNGTIIRAVNVVDDVIYTGCYMEFGYWKRDEYGNLNYTSLIKKIGESLIEDEHIWNIINFEQWVLFQSLDRIYIYDTVDESFNIINSKSKRAEIFKVGNSIYFQRLDVGLFKIEKGKPILISDNDTLKNNVLVGLFELNNKLLLLTEKGEFYFIDTNQITKWRIPSSKELEQVVVYSSLQLSDGSFVLGTISDGVYHLSNEGVVIRKINQLKGLANNTVLSVLEDVDNNLWLGLDNGISVINLNSPFTIFNDLYGKLGAVYASEIFNGKLYIGTNQGLYSKIIDSDDEFNLVKNTNGQVWCLKVIDKTLFLGHNNGTFIVENETAKQIANYPGTWDIKTLPQSNLLIQGNYGGMSILQKINNQWTFRNKIEGFDISTRFFELLEENKVLVNHEFKGVYNLQLDADYQKVIKQNHKEPNGYGSNLTNYNNSIIYASNNGIFQYKSNNSFVRDSTLNNIFFNREDPLMGKLIAINETNKLFGFTKNNIVLIEPGKLNTTPQVFEIPVPDFFRRNLGLAGFESLMHLKNEEYLIGTLNGFTVLDLNKINTKRYEITINSITKDYLNGEMMSLSLSEGEVLPYKDNNITINFSVPHFDKYATINYQYKLSGLYEEWSSFSPNPFVRFENLPYGEYDFLVRAKIGNELTINNASFKFVIQRPWYLSYKMIGLYFLAFMSFAGLIHKTYKIYYRKQHEKLVEENEKKLEIHRLENEQELMKIRNDKLRLEIESKNKELAVSTMGLINKNDILLKIKEQLERSDDHIKNVKSVIRIIKTNTSEEDNWNFFKEAFNNADSDFLKKIKEMHPDLTPNDLRLCAYLRLNLSTKEIAPLLNISTRSVEIKRYRLRKKLNLPHEDSLVDYIIKI